MDTNTQPTTVTLAGQTFTTEQADGGPMFLTGKRGGVYFLRGYSNDNTGRHQVISWKTGQPLRDRTQKAVEVFWLGDIIERAN
jgi:hypothetical protein